MPKDTYRNEAKIRSIEKQREFIKRNLIEKHRKDPKDLKVAFFPGREALEYEVAYEPLGIPSQNIYAIERDPETHAYWKEDGRFQVTSNPIDDKDFFENYEGPPFDVISLDYDGYLREESLDCIELISSAELLDYPGVLVTNFYAKREKDSIRKFYALSSSLLDTYKRLDLSKEGGVHEMELTRHYQEILEDEDKWKESKDRSITSEVGITMFAGRNSFLEVCKRFNPYFERVDRELREAFIKRAKDKLRSLDLEENKKEGEYLEKRISLLKTASTEELFSMNDMYEFQISHEGNLSQYLRDTPAKEGSFVYLESLIKDRPLLDSLKRFRYTSENGGLMFTDMFGFISSKSILGKYHSLIFPVITKSKLILEYRGTSRDAEKVAKNFKKDLRTANRKAGIILNQSKYKPRQDLGSSFKPIIRSKERLRELVAQGLSQEEIESQFRISSSVMRSLPAFMAHRTRGTYEQEEPLEEPEQNSEQTSLLEEIAKEPTELKLIPRGKRKQLRKIGRFTDGMDKRLEYFKDDIFHLSEPKRRELYDSVLESRWYSPIFNKEVSDTRVYAFFDDLMLYVKKKRRIPSSEEVKNIWHHGIKLRSYTKKRLSPKKSPEEHNEEIYGLIMKCTSDEEIMQEFDLTKRQLGARKAWVTMRQRV